MNTRTASRELALLLIYQLEATQKLTQDLKSNHDLQEKLQDRKVLEDAILAVVRSLNDEARKSIEDTASSIAQVSQYIISLEAEHPANLKLPLDAENQPVAIPTTRDMLEKLEIILAGAEQLSQAFYLPELLALTERPDVIDYAIKLIGTVLKHLADIDRWIEQGAKDWKLDRLARLDRCLLRLAVGEMRFRPGVDDKVVIDEYIELSKGYCGLENYRFINGVLGYVMSTPLQDEPIKPQEATAMAHAAAPGAE